MKQCKWHLCRKEFKPSRITEDFCCPDHRRARAAWRAQRGSTLVDLLIDGDMEKLQERRGQLLEEINANET